MGEKVALCGRVHTMQFGQRIIINALVCTALCCSLSAVALPPSEMITEETVDIPRHPWGDDGKGRYINPVLNADYSDPDLIRMGEKYYMVCSDFHFMGMPILESDDLINWRIIAQIYSSIDFAEYYRMERYGGGSWAPAIRWHKGLYYVYFCTPNEGLFVSTAEDVAGPWSPLYNVVNISGWEDPCPLWDDDGQAYLGRSQLGGGPIILHKMSVDGKKLLDDGTTIYTGPTAEGTKLFKKDGYYWISIPEGGVSTGWQTVMRAKNIYGPYEKRVVLEQRDSPINGPHQGAFIDTPSGEWWFCHFQSRDPLGRVMHLQPVEWPANDFPRVGVEINANGTGKPVASWQKPSINKDVEIHKPQSSDEFSSTEKGLQWQFNHNPVDSAWSLVERPGYLRLKALKADRLRTSKNALSQKVTGFYARISTELDCSNLSEGQRAGLLCTGHQYRAIGVERRGGKNFIYTEIDGNINQFISIDQNIVYLTALADGYNNDFLLSYSLNNTTFIPCGRGFPLYSGDWKGARVGVFTYNTENSTGIADFNWFRYKCYDHDHTISHNQ
ncbi:MAG: glycoside hydrolase 43 family protein [Prevotellaceae bacterium]|nr:glycoside hydrolase 43 family protein [Prevotellaceae bacterium]